MEKLGTEEGKKLDELLGRLYRENVPIHMFGAEPRGLINAEWDLAERLVADGYAELLMRKHDGAVGIFCITPQGRAFWNAGGYKGKLQELAYQRKERKWSLINTRTTVVVIIVSLLISVIAIIKDEIKQLLCRTF